MKKVLSVFSLVMINVIAVDSLRTLPIGAEYGLSLLFYYCLAAFIFFIPVALIAAELATGWPKMGGIYVWVREAFGRKAGFTTIWLQWIYNIVWYPTILAFMASAIAYLINPKLANDKDFLVSCVLILFWAATLANCFGMRVSSVISTLGAIVGTLLPMFFIIGLGVTWLILGKPVQLSFSTHHVLPSISSINTLVFFTAILFGLIGMEMSAVHAEEVKNPKTDYPKALLISTIIIFLSLVLASLAIALVVPQKQLSLVSGMVDAFAIFFKAYRMPWMINVIVLMIIMGGLSSVSAWVIGPTKGLIIAAKDANMPKWFSELNSYGAPVNLLLIQAMIVTLLCTVFLLFKNINNSYWLLSDITAQLALIVYIFMFLAAIKLRYSQPDVHRNYRVPGGKIVMNTVAGLGSLTCLMAIIIGYFPPSQLRFTSIWQYELTLVGGLIILTAPALWLCRDHAA